MISERLMTFTILTPWLSEYISENQGYRNADLRKEYADSVTRTMQATSSFFCHASCNKLMFISAYSILKTSCERSISFKKDTNSRNAMFLNSLWQFEISKINSVDMGFMPSICLMKESQSHGDVLGEAKYVLKSDPCSNLRASLDKELRDARRTPGQMSEKEMINFARSSSIDMSPANSILTSGVPLWMSKDMKEPEVILKKDVHQFLRNKLSISKIRGRDYRNARK